MLRLGVHQAAYFYAAMKHNLVQQSTPQRQKWQSARFHQSGGA
jgi:hypothetical protein